MTNNFPALPLIKNCMLINSPQASNGYSGPLCSMIFSPTQTRNAISKLICSYSQITSSLNKVLFMPVQQIFNPRNTDKHTVQLVRVVYQN